MKVMIGTLAGMHKNRAFFLSVSWSLIPLHIYKTIYAENSREGSISQNILSRKQICFSKENKVMKVYGLSFLKLYCTLHHIIHGTATHQKLNF